MKVVDHPDNRETVIPLYGEALSVSKRQIERGRVQVEVRVVEQEQAFEQTLERHDVEVRRVAVGRVVETAPETRQEGDVVIVPVVEEEVVLVKQLVLREEIHLRKRATQRTGQFTVTLRSEHAEIIRDGVRQELSASAGSPRNAGE